MGAVLLLMCLLVQPAQAGETPPAARTIDANAVYMQPMPGLDEAQLKQFRA